MTRPVTLQTLCLLLLTSLSMPALGQGTIKGRLVWPDTVAIPENPEAKVDKDRMHCLSKGKVRVDRLIVHSMNRGIKNAAFWLVDRNKSLRPLPLNDGAKKLPRAIVIDSPCCAFEPRIAVVAPGQKLVVKNSAPIPHNINIIGGADGPVAPALPGTGRLEIEPIKPRLFPIPYSCTIHAWMKGYIIASPSPYAAVTDANGNFEIKHAPKGKYKLIGWHEEIGWIFPAAKSVDTGKVIEIKDGKTTDLGKLIRKVEDD